MTKARLGPILIAGCLAGLAVVGLTIGIRSTVSGVPGAVLSAVSGAVLGMAGAGLLVRTFVSDFSASSRIEANSIELSGMDRGLLDESRDRLDSSRVAVSEIVATLSVLSEAASRLAEGATEQTGAVPRTTKTVESLYDRIDRISQNADEAADATERARQQATRGLEQIQGVIAGMDRLALPGRIEFEKGPTPGRAFRRDRDHRRIDRRDLKPHRHARAERDDRVRPSRRARPRVCRRRRRNPKAGRAFGGGNAGDRHARRGDSSGHSREHPFSG